MLHPYTIWYDYISTVLEKSLFAFVQGKEQVLYFLCDRQRIRENYCKRERLHKFIVRDSCERERKGASMK